MSGWYNCPDIIRKNKDTILERNVINIWKIFNSLLKYQIIWQWKRNDIVLMRLKLCYFRFSLLFSLLRVTGNDNVSYFWSTLADLKDDLKAYRHALKATKLSFWFHGVFKRLCRRLAHCSVCVWVIHERQPCFCKQLIAAWDVSSFSRHSKVKRSDVSIRY